MPFDCFKLHVPEREAYNVFPESNMSTCIGILRGMRVTPDTQGRNLAIRRLDWTSVSLYDIWGEEERQWVYFSFWSNENTDEYRWIRKNKYRCLGIAKSWSIRSLYRIPNDNSIWVVWVFCFFWNHTLKQVKESCTALLGELEVEISNKSGAVNYSPTAQTAHRHK